VLFNTFNFIVQLRFLPRVNKGIFIYFLNPAYHIERSDFELNRTQSNVNRTIKFDFVRSSNQIELTKNKCKSNEIERSIKSVNVRFSSVAERHLSERLTSSHDMIWIERMFGFHHLIITGINAWVNASIDPAI